MPPKKTHRTPVKVMKTRGKAKALPKAKAWVVSGLVFLWFLFAAPLLRVIGFLGPELVTRASWKQKALYRNKEENTQKQTKAQNEKQKMTKV